ncbi:UBP1-associated protein 2B [Brachypodium distachyon]|uniref:RRM domain-containing protein n=1 Tax=Brachypodium distachyon TaxID=15368 RepID=I1IBB7_BRADI|nr:UBP1-associated protein 2B [Brachypodium distachyon]PNT68990.1 hypothetical protein BRADI_3g48030v3 [Brachypodium distachyon]|eukprot:XP_024316675.1 UBP1-associated protein 2B [Brachypodium distachyon]
MGRKRKRKRRASKDELSEERADPEMAGEGVGEEEGHDDSATNQPPLMLDDCEEGEEEEAIEGLLEPFSRGELLDLLVEACLRDSALLSRLAASAASDATHRRLFVHGLGPGSNSAALAAAFAPFGVLEESHAVADRATGRCRGYGFVTFRRSSSARRALADASKRVGDRPVACQLASLGSAGPCPEMRKLFVDKVPAGASRDELRKFFCQFGEIEAGPLGADHATGRFHRYAIFLYKSPGGLRKALEEPRKVFDGCELHCRPAHSKKRATAEPINADGQINATGSTALPTFHPKEVASTSGMHPLLGSNSPMAKGTSSTEVLFYHNAGAGGAGILGASPLAMAVPSTHSRNTLDSH